MFWNGRYPKRMVITGIALGVMIASSLSAVDAAAGGRKGRKWRNKGTTERCENVSRVRCSPRPVNYGTPKCDVVTPWYRDARRVVIAGDPFYYNAALGVYLGGVALHLNLSNAAPAGYLYYDPVCNEQFTSVRGYKRHLRSHRHVSGLVVVRTCDMDCDGQCGHDHNQWDDHAQWNNDRGYDNDRYRDVAWRSDKDDD